MRATLSRLKHYQGDNVEFRIGGKHIAAEEETDVAIDLGQIITSLWDLPLPPCPDCRGTIVWAEAGLVPGARECSGCASRFSIDTVSINI